VISAKIPDGGFNESLSEGIGHGSWKFEALIKGKVLVTQSPSGLILVHVRHEDHPQGSGIVATPLSIRLLNFHRPKASYQFAYPYNIITRDKMSHSNIHHGDASSSGNAHYSHNTHSFNVSNSDCVWNIGVTDEKSEILAWLSPLEPRIRHQHLRTLRADTVGEWLLQTQEFQTWCDGAQQGGSEHAILFCCGGPAVGKTYLR